MGINVNSGFSVGAPVPIDERLILSKSQMKNIATYTMPTNYLAVCSDNGELYVYNSAGEFSNETGYFSPITAHPTAENVTYDNTNEPDISNVKEMLDKLIAQGGGVTKQVIKPNVQQGSVKTSYPVGTLIEEIIIDMLTEKIPPAVTINLNPSTALYNIVTDSVSSITINATVTKNTNAIKQVDYYVNDELVHSNTSATANGTYPYIYNTVINETTTFKIIVTDSEGLTSTALKKIEFYPVIYYGIIDANTGEPTEALIKTLSTKLQNTKTFIYEGITTDWGKVCVCIPKMLGTVTSIFDTINNMSYNISFARTTVSVDGYEYEVLTQIDASAADNITLKFA